MSNISRRNFIFRAAGALSLASISPSLLAAIGSSRIYNIGVCDWTLGYAGSPKAFDFAKEIGLDGVQLSSAKKLPQGDFFSPLQFEEFKQKMAQTGLKVPSTAPTCMNAHPFYSADGAVEFTKLAIDASAELGGKTILLPFYGPANMQGPDKRMDEKHFAPLVERLKQLVPHAQKRGVKVCMENSVSAEENIRIIDAVGSDWIKVYFDIFNSQYYGHNTLEEIRILGKKYIGEIHLKDKGHKLDSGSNLPENMEACLQAIFDIGYDGWLVMELHGHNPQKDGTVVEVLKHNLEYLKKNKSFI